MCTQVVRDTEAGEASRSPHIRRAGRQTGRRVVYGGDTCSALHGPFRYCFMFLGCPSTFM
ncbi:hypothetical protein E2C01_044610 [Portunus trituberculatus]|uniref:Uncharacterized protein n=1 Tax=Portunus trituberculatus TaxID=210409 RepID=A0A5B7FYU5_PORTR|nr:hypothetical protein [Portunus trituberculatus]